MTFFGEYVKEKKKAKANPESSMLIPEFCNFFFKCRVRSRVVARSETCHGFMLSLDKHYKGKPVPGPGFSECASVWAP